MANDINKEDPHYKGEYGSIYEVNRNFPTGGVAGDFVVIDGWAHYWNAARGTWCVNAERDSYWDELITNIIEKFKLVRSATYMGVASLDTVPTKVIGVKMYYFATVAGTYKNFDNLVVPQGINVLYSDNGSSWVNTTLLEVAQELGVSTNKVVCQKAVSDKLSDLEKKIGDRFVVEGDVINFPDEEDLTSVKGAERDVLKLADRSYAPYKFSGKGYKILRKNIQSVSIAVTKIRVESIPSKDGTLTFTINGKETQVAVSASTDNTTAKIAQKVVSALQESMTEYEVSVDASLITLTRKSNDSVTPSAFSVSTTGVVGTITDSTKRESRNVLTPIMINQPNTIYEIRYDFDLNGLGITMPEDSILKFNGGTIVNGVVYSNKTKIINIPKDFNIMGNIYNINGKEITIKGDVLNKKIKILAPSVVYTPKWWKSDFGEDRFMKIARDIGITDFYTLVRIDNTTLPNYQCQPCPEFADPETLANRFLSNGYKEIFGIKFHTENNFNNTESPDKIMPNFINYIVDYVKAVINKGLILHNIDIVNEESDWTREDSEYIDYIVELANRITQLGLTPRISFDSIYNLRLADSKLYNCISPDFNFYPTISFLDRDTRYDKDISNELIEGFKNTYNMAWGRCISTFGMSESGICANEKAFRYPWEYRTEYLGKSMPKAPVIYWEIISDFINALNCPFVDVWFFEGLTKENNIDIDALYNIFINKIS